MDGQPEKVKTFAKERRAVSDGKTPNIIIIFSMLLKATAKKTCTRWKIRVDKRLAHVYDYRVTYYTFM